MFTHTVHLQPIYKLIDQCWVISPEVQTQTKTCSILFLHNRSILLPCLFLASSVQRSQFMAAFTTSWPADSLSPIHTHTTTILWLQLYPSIWGLFSHREGNINTVTRSMTCCTYRYLWQLYMNNMVYPFTLPVCSANQLDTVHFYFHPGYPLIFLLKYLFLLQEFTSQFLWDFCWINNSLLDKIILSAALISLLLDSHWETVINMFVDKTLITIDKHVW